MPLVVTGTIGVDTIHTPTAQVEGVAGGSAAYFAAAASFLGPVRIVAAVGGDWPNEHRRSLEGFAGLCTKGLEIRPGSRTFAWGGRYFENLNRRETLFTELGVLQEEPPQVPKEYRDSRFVFLANTHPGVQLRLLRSFERRELVVADTMDLWINIARDDLRTLLKEVDGVILNDSESALLTEIPNAISAAQAILEMGPRFVVVKKGEHGAVLVHREGVATVPAFPSPLERVIDPTGAGDTFAGGLMGHVARVGRGDLATLQAGLAWGTVLASFTIESFGLDGLRRIHRADIDARIEEFRSVARIG
ncbi:MAG: sugar kinase [Phycisphaerae bacterium]|nr:sugar kinase [Phycisphaerae bacterium]